MKITVCVGSSCHLRGSRSVAEKLKELIAKNNLQDKLEIGGTFCLGQCGEGVSVEFDGKVYSVTEDGVEEFFVGEVLSGLK